MQPVYRKSHKDMIELLTIPPASRSDRQIIAIASYFNTHKFFKDLTENKLDRVLYTNITVIQLEKDDVLFKYGDQPSAFYFVLTGAVDVYVPVKGSGEVKHIDLDDNQMHFKRVSTIGSGGTFGELALIAQRPRAATIVATNSCTLAVCDRLTYLHCINEKETLKLTVTTDNINALLPFKIERSQLMKLVYFLKPFELKLNNDVYIESQNCTHLYILIEGEIKVS